MLESRRYGADKYDSASPNGWYVVRIDDAGETEAIAGPFCDKGVSDRHLDEINRAARAMRARAA